MTMIRHRFCTFAALLCVAAGIAAAPVPSAAPELHVGDSWTYRTLDGFTHETRLEFTHRVVEVNDREIVDQYHKSGNETKTALRYFNRDGNPLDTGDTRFEPYYPEYKFPMSAGMAWTDKFTSFTTDGNVFTGYVTGKVSALEKVTVAGGTFDAYRIEKDAETRGTGANSVVTKAQITTWYAPAVKRYVRREAVTTRDGRVRDHYIEELVEYKLASPN